MPGVRMIDANALKIHVCNMCDDGQRECKGDESCAILCWINDMPTIEEEPVRHGRWIELPPALNPSERPHKCSECGHVLSFYGAYPKACYCPHCGTKMDGGTNND